MGKPLGPRQLEFLAAHRFPNSFRFKPTRTGRPHPVMHRDRPDAGLNLALAMMAVANDTVPARIVLQIAVRRDEGRDLHLNGLRQETLRSRAQDHRQGILRK